MTKIVMDLNGRSTGVVELVKNTDLDGTNASAASGVIDATRGRLVRLVATGGNVRYVTGATPVAVSTDIIIMEGSELWIPVAAGHKVAVIGGICNVSVAL